MRFYFDWIVDHRFTDFLAAKRDLFLYPVDAAAIERFRSAIRALVERLAADAATPSFDPQRRFLLRRFSEELAPLLTLSESDGLAARVAQVEAHLIEVQDLVRSDSKR